MTQCLPGGVHAHGKGLICNMWGFLAVSSGAIGQDPRSGFSRSLILGLMCFSSAAAEEAEQWESTGWQQPSAVGDRGLAQLAGWSAGKSGSSWAAASA